MGIHAVDRSLVNDAASPDVDPDLGEGIAELQRWMCDLVREGLAAVQGKSYAFWNVPAARMDDARAPGVARFVRDMSGIPSSGEGWESRLLERLGALHLLLEAWKRRQTLSPDTQADLRAIVGLAQNEHDLMRQPAIRDHWIVLGQHIEVEDRVRAVSTWLWGRQTSRGALIVSSAPVIQPQGTTFVLGTVVDAELVFHPGTPPLRAVLKSQHAAPAPLQETPAGWTAADAMSRYAAALAQNPWLDRFPMLIRDVVPVREADGWIIQDQHARVIQLAPRAFGWDLLAISGGGPLTVFGEFDGALLHPHSAFCDARFTPVRGVHEPLG